MRAVIGLLLLFVGAEVVYLVVTGKLGATPASGNGNGNNSPQSTPLPGSSGSGGIIPVTSPFSPGGNLPVNGTGIIPV